MTKPPALTVVVADDTWHYADALALGLGREADIRVVGVAYSAEQALEIVGKAGPRVVLVDLDLPTMGGIALCGELRDRYPEVAAVVVTASATEALAREALAAGATAYVVKEGPDDPGRVAAAIRSAARGDRLISRDVAGVIDRVVAGEQGPADELGLTPREREVLPLVAAGKSNKQIAEELGIGLQGVKNHVGALIRKLGATNRTEAVDLARQRGLLG